MPLILTPITISICKYAQEHGLDKAIEKYNIKHSTLERYLRAYRQQMAKDNTDVGGLEYTASYVYNKEDRKYIFHLNNS